MLLLPIFLVFTWPSKIHNLIYLLLSHLICLYIDMASVTIKIIALYFLRYHTDFQIGKLELLFAVYALLLRKISDKNIRKIKYGKKRWAKAYVVRDWQISFFDYMMIDGEPIELSLGSFERWFFVKKFVHTRNFWYHHWFYEKIHFIFSDHTYF